MTELNDLQKRFDTVAQANSRPTLSQEQFDLLVQGESPQTLAWLAKLVAAAGEGRTDALELFKTLHTAVRITDALKANGFPDICKRTARIMIDTYGGRVSNATRALIDGDQQSRQEIRAWLQEAKAKLAEKTGEPAPAPARNAQPAQGAAQASRFGQVPPPPGVRTGQVQVVDQHPQGSASTVTQFPQDRQRQAPQAPAQSRQAQAYATSDDPRTQARPQHPPRQPERVHSRQDNGAGQGNGAQRQYDQHECYGKDIAVQFQNLPTREGDVNTVMIKIARAKGATCKQGVDWNNAILINLEPHEVQTCTAVLLGYGSKVRYAGHGQANDKWFEMQETTDDWAGSIRLQVGQGDEKRSVNIGPTDVGEVAAVFGRALTTQMRSVNPTLIPLILRRAYDLYQKNAASTEARRNGGGNRPQQQRTGGGYQQQGGQQRRAHG